MLSESLVILSTEELEQVTGGGIFSDIMTIFKDIFETNNEKA